MQTNSCLRSASIAFEYLIDEEALVHKTNKNIGLTTSVCVLSAILHQTSLPRIQKTLEIIFDHDNRNTITNQIATRVTSRVDSNGDDNIILFVS